MRSECTIAYVVARRPDICLALTRYAPYADCCLPHDVLKTRRREDAKTRRREDAKTRRREDAETRRRGDAETRRRGDAETRRRGDAENCRKTTGRRIRAGPSVTQQRRLVMAVRLGLMRMRMG